MYCEFWFDRIQEWREQRTRQQAHAQDAGEAATEEQNRESPDRMEVDPPLTAPALQTAAVTQPAASASAGPRIARGDHPVIASTLAAVQDLSRSLDRAVRHEQKHHNV